MHKGDHEMRKKLQVIAFALGLVFVLRSQTETAESIFPKGELSTSKNHTGNIWLKELSVGESTFDPTIAVATYGAGAKLDWHANRVPFHYSHIAYMQILANSSSD
jgi:hypothetical protein